jgi:hypothetical protein
LSKFGEISPEKTNTGQDRSQATVFFCFFFFFFFFFFIIETLAIFSKKLAKLVEFTVPKTKFAKQIPISLSKIGQISPKKKHWTGNELH